MALGQKIELDWNRETSIVAMRRKTEVHKEEKKKEHRKRLEVCEETVQAVYRTEEGKLVHNTLFKTKNGACRCTSTVRSGLSTRRCVGGAIALDCLPPVFWEADADEGERLDLAADRRRNIPATARRV